MSPPGRPKNESFERQREGSSVSPGFGALARLRRVARREDPERADAEPARDEPAEREPAAISRRAGCVALMLAAGGAALPAAAQSASNRLPAPALTGAMSLEAVLAARRSVRRYADGALSPAELGQLLWAAQGITGRRGLRTAPSAGATYPLEIQVAVGRVTDLAAGVYRYQPHEHELRPVAPGDVRAQLAEAALGQPWVAQAPVSLVIAAVMERTMRRYGARGRMYVHMEVGHAAQNVLLQAVALRMGSVAVGAFRDDEVARVMRLGADEVPKMILPVGHRSA